jgi:hypothetical protein
MSQVLSDGQPKITRSRSPDSRKCGNRERLLGACSSDRDCEGVFVEKEQGSRVTCSRLIISTGGIQNRQRTAALGFDVPAENCFLGIVHDPTDGTPAIAQKKAGILGCGLVDQEMVAGVRFELTTFGLCDLSQLSLRVGLYLHPVTVEHLTVKYYVSNYCDFPEPTHPSSRCIESAPEQRAPA